MEVMGWPEATALLGCGICCAYVASVFIKGLFS